MIFGQQLAGLVCNREHLSGRGFPFGFPNTPKPERYPQQPHMKVDKRMLKARPPSTSGLSRLIRLWFPMKTHGQTGALSRHTHSSAKDARPLLLWHNLRRFRLVSQHLRSAAPKTLVASTVQKRPLMGEQLTLTGRRSGAFLSGQKHCQSELRLGNSPQSWAVSANQLG